MTISIVSWRNYTGFRLPSGWNPVPFRLKNGALIHCPFDELNQPCLMRPAMVDMTDNITWAKRLGNEFIFIRLNDPKNTVQQFGRFDYQRPPKTNLFLAIYTSFASYNLGILGYYSGLSKEDLFLGGGVINFLHSLSNSSIDTSGADGLSKLNTWCIRRAYQDARMNLV